MSQDLRRTWGGWEKFPSSKPTSAASRDLHMEELAADGDLAGLKDAPSFSRVQTFMAWLVLFLFLIAIGGLSATIFAFARAAVKPDGADPRPSAASCCPEGWIGAGGNCYYFSEDERNWETSQNYCSGHAASLAANDSLEALNITLHRKGPSNHWVGLRREPGQPWRWVDGTAFNHPLTSPLEPHSFAIRGSGLCAYLADGVVSSAGCDTERKWACSKPHGRIGASPEDAEC